MLAAKLPMLKPAMGGSALATASACSVTVPPQTPPAAKLAGTSRVAFTCTASCPPRRELADAAHGGDAAELHHIRTRREGADKAVVGGRRLRRGLHIGEADAAPHLARGLHGGHVGHRLQLSSLHEQPPAVDRERREHHGQQQGQPPQADGAALAKKLIC
jgi:hypothetical protein